MTAVDTVIFMYDDDVKQAPEHYTESILIQNLRITFSRKAEYNTDSAPSMSKMEWGNRFYLFCM